MTKRLLLGIGLLSLTLAGCDSIGNAPAGPTRDQVQAEINSAKPQDQIDLIKGSPLKPAEKAQRIKDIEDKYHVTDQKADQGASGPPQHQ